MIILICLKWKKLVHSVAYHQYGDVIGATVCGISLRFTHNLSWMCEKNKDQRPPSLTSVNGQGPVSI